MNFKIDADSDQPRRKLEKPPDYMSTRVRLRLMSLMAMLILVLLAMKTASKPETWERLGFQSEPVDQEAAVNANLSPSLTIDAGPLSESTDGVSSTTVDRSEPESQVIGRKIRQSIDDASIDESFWKQIYVDLTPVQRKDLFRLLRYGRNELPLPQEYRSTAETLIAYIERQRQAHHLAVAEKIATFQEADIRQQLEATLTDSQVKWKAVQKAIADVAILQTPELRQQAIDLASIQSTLDAVAFQQVRDQTSMTRAADGPAWIRSWETVLDGRFAATAKPVTLFQLVNQPGYYRGKGVKVRGNVRGAEKITVPENELGIRQYYVLWMRPEESNLAPYCIYALCLPDEFPSVGNQFTSLNQNVEADGVFFKIRSYMTRNGEVENCPLILAESFDWIRVQEVAETNWVPPTWLIWPFLVLMPMVAGLWAYRVYRTTRTTRHSAANVTRQKIETELVNLSKDKSIQTDAERIQMLYQRDTDSSEATDG